MRTRKSKKSVYLFISLIVFILFSSFLFFRKNTPNNLPEYCAFCDSTVLEAQTFYEDEVVLALYTHKPVFPGHCLIIPKRHVRSFEDLSEVEASQIAQVIKKVHQVVQKTFHTSPYLLLQKNGSEVGQTVPHVHFHYIPREKGEGSSLKFILNMYLANTRKPMQAEKMEEIVSQLRKEMDTLI